MNALDLNALEKLIASKNWWFSASELQGIIGALLAFKHSEYASELLCIDKKEPFLEKFIEHQRNTLNDNNLSYALLLQENPLQHRAENLTQWCTGFLLAYRFLQEKQQITLKDPQIEEYLKELEAISQLDLNIKDNEENAQQLMNLEEHCRLGIYLIHGH